MHIYPIQFNLLSLINLKLSEFSFYLILNPQNLQNTETFWGNSKSSKYLMKIFIQISGSDNESHYEQGHLNKNVTQLKWCIIIIFEKTEVNFKIYSKQSTLNRTREIIIIIFE
jgi:hypothetical protein